MKILFLLLSSSFLFSCSKGNNTEAKQFVVSRAMIEQKLDEELAQKQIKKCEFSPKEQEEPKGFLARMKDRIIKDNIKKNDFDLKFSTALTRSVLSEMREYAIDNRRFTPEEFWLSLSPKTTKKINRYLIQEFARLNDKSFLRLKDFVASSFLFYFLEKDKSLGYEFQVDEPEVPLSTVKVSFSEYANFEKREKLNLCELNNKGAIHFKSATEENIILPSDITSHIVCENKKKGQKIDFRVIQDQDLKITVTLDSKNYDYSLAVGELEVSSFNHLAKLNFSTLTEQVELKAYKAQGDDYLALDDSGENYRESSFSSLSFRSERNGKIIKTKGLSCEEYKEFLYE